MILIALMLSLCLFDQASAQEERLRFEHLTSEDGLSQNTVRAILQDQLGFLWFGTDEGLNKYDGYSFTVYQRDPDDAKTLASNSVLALLEDRQGQLWIGTSAGLDRFEHESQVFTHYFGDGNGPFGAVSALVEDDLGRIWIGTSANGIWRMEPGSGDLTHYRHDSLEPDSLGNNAIYQILLDSSGQIWIATDGGLDLYLPEEDNFSHYRRAISNPDSPSSSRVRAVIEDRSGGLWLGTDGGGLNRFDRKTGKFTFYMQSNVDPQSLSDNRIWDIEEDDQGRLWIATPAGLNRFDPETGRFTHYIHDIRDPSSISGSWVLTLFEDRSGVLWIGTQGAGLSQYKPGAHKFTLYQARAAEEDLGTNSVSAIIEDPRGGLWIGTNGAGLNRLERVPDQWKSYRATVGDKNGISSDNVAVLMQDRAAMLWVGTFGGGLDRFDPRSESITHYRYVYNDPNSLSSNNISALLEDRQGQVWAATLDAGLNLLDGETGHFSHFRHDLQDPGSLSSDQITAIYQDQQGVLWVGTFDAGLNRFQPGTGVVRRYQYDPGSANSLSSNQVLSLFEDPAGTLWVGTKEGLNRFDVTQEIFTRYTMRNGLPSNTINCILADEAGNLWISTTNGLARFDPQFETIRSYNVDDGLQSREFHAGACFQGRDGELFFGGVQGFNRFLPDEIVDVSIPPPVVITAFKVKNQLVLRDLSAEEHIQLNYQDDFVSFEFAALDFHAPQKNQFMYKLEGFDDDWIDAGERNFASYTNLEGGSYIFRVRAANSDGAWNETGASVMMTVLPPVWETGWFRAALVLGLLGVILGGYRLRMRSIYLQNKALEQKVGELSQQVKEAAITAERNRLARDLHDSITQSLYSLTLLAEAARRMLQAGDVDEARGNVTRLGEIAQQGLQEMRLMVYQLRSPDLENAGLAGAIEHRLEAVERRAGMAARLIVTGNPVVAPQTEQVLYRLAQEALNNALKHSGSRSVTVSLRAEEQCLTLEVRDDGCGFDPVSAEGGGGYGLRSMRERAEQLGGRLTIDSKPGAGTCIRFFLPVDGQAASVEGKKHA